MNDGLLTTIFEDIYTYQQYKNRAKFLRETLVRRIFGSKDKDSDLSAHSQGNLWLSKNGGKIFQQFNKDNVYQILGDIDTAAKKLPVLTLYIPADLPDEEIDKLGLHIRNLIGKTILIDIKLNPSLLAGCALVWNGIYKDFSIKEAIDQKKEEILAQFRGFLR